MEDNKQEKVVIQFVNKIGKGLFVCKELRELCVFLFR